MLKKTIEYVDYNGVARKEDHWFNLSKAELMEMELGTTGGFAEMIQKVINAQDTPSLIKIFKDLILQAYGEKSPDGKRFMKVVNGVRLSDAFAESEAYVSLFMELATDADAATKFVNGIIPADVANEAAKSAIPAPPMN